MEIECRKNKIASNYYNVTTLVISNSNKDILVKKKSKLINQLGSLLLCQKENLLN